MSQMQKNTVSKVPDNLINRRKFLNNLAFVMGASLTPIGAKALDAALSTKPSVTKPLLLTAKQLEIVKVLADVIIPATDTPGASGVGVPHYINQVLSLLLSIKERDLMFKGINERQGILTLSDKARIKHVQQLDDKRKDDAFFLPFKQLTIIGYYTSEIGATQELIYDPIPGPYKEVPFSSIGKSWA